MHPERLLCTALGGTCQNAADTACPSHDKCNFTLKIQRQSPLSTVLTIVIHYAIEVIALKRVKLNTVIRGLTDLAD